MKRWLALAIAAPILGACNSIAGVDDLVDHPCAQELCTDGSVVADTALAIVANDTTPAVAAADSSSPDTIVRDTIVTDTFVLETFVSDTFVPDAGSKSETGVCSGGPAPLVTIIAGAGGYAIAATETTRAQYAAFLAAAPMITQPDDCRWNTSFLPAGWSAPSSSECALPVAGVDWCDAWSYCNSIGRRLCGRIGGGTLDPSGSEVKDPAVDEWHRVCTANGTTDYSYGASHSPGVCVDYAFDGTATFNASTDVPRNVGTATGCKGPTAPYSGVFDMTGNLREWEDACNSEGSSTENLCRTRGGAFNETNLSCNTGTLFRRADRPINVGIRCCATVL